MDKVKSVKHNDQRKLICQLFILQKVLHSLWAVAIAFSANPLHLIDMPSFAGSLYVLEMDFWIFGGVDNGAEEVEGTLK